MQKVRNDEDYARKLYAALCNMQWQKREVWPLLAEDLWACTWRYAGAEFMITMRARVGGSIL